MLREFVTEVILGPVAAAAGAADADESGPGQAGPEFRAALAASQMLGLALTRYVLALGPVATASADDLAAAIGPTLERYLTGDIQVPGGIRAPGEGPGGPSAGSPRLGRGPEHLPYPEPAPGAQDRPLIDRARQPRHPDGGRETDRGGQD